MSCFRNLDVEGANRGRGLLSAAHENLPSVAGASWGATLPGGISDSTLLLDLVLGNKQHRTDTIWLLRRLG